MRRFQVKSSAPAPAPDHGGLGGSGPDAVEPVRARYPFPVVIKPIRSPTRFLETLLRLAQPPEFPEPPSLNQDTAERLRPIRLGVVRGVDGVEGLRGG